MEEQLLSIGDNIYSYSKDENGKETLKRKGRIGNQDIDIIITSENNENNNEIEKNIISILSDIYIKKHIEKLKNT